MFIKLFRQKSASMFMHG